MLGWMLRRLVEKNFRRDLRYAQDTLGLHQARRACEELLRSIYAVKLAGRFGREADLLATNDAISTALHGLPTGWFSRLQPNTVTLALLDDWLSAKRASLTGELDARTFRFIDDELWSFVKSRLNPQEIEAIHSEVAESPALRRRPDINAAIDELIRDYAAIAEIGAEAPIAHASEIQVR